METIGDFTLVEFAAMLAHEANRIYCLSIGDKSQPHWEDAPDWQQSSALKGARMIYDNPLTTPEDSHNGWLSVKQEEGWVYGEVKDAEAKTHPCMVPYSELPESQRVKDEIFGTVVRSILSLGE